MMKITFLLPFLIWWSSLHPAGSKQQIFIIPGTRTTTKPLFSLLLGTESNTSPVNARKRLLSSWLTWKTASETGQGSRDIPKGWEACCGLEQSPSHDVCPARFEPGAVLPSGATGASPTKGIWDSLPVMGLRHWLGHTKGKQNMLEEKQFYPNPALALGARTAWD